mmetsp:Transcript_22651/g.61317  ORF Transcript_22651/g.61317 Transcript_22651/m.61317 type:complete len:349 (+) Transcript_22651:247-1293(+)
MMQRCGPAAARRPLVDRRRERPERTSRRPSGSQGAPCPALSDCQSGAVGAWLHEHEALPAAIGDDAREDDERGRETRTHDGEEEAAARHAVIVECVLGRKLHVHAKEASYDGVDGHAQRADGEEQLQLDELVAVAVELDCHVVLRIGDVVAQFLKLLGGPVNLLEVGLHHVLQVLHLLVHVRLHGRAPRQVHGTQVRARAARCRHDVLHREAHVLELGLRVKQLLEFVVDIFNLVLHARHLRLHAPRRLEEHARHAVGEAIENGRGRAHERVHLVCEAVAHLLEAQLERAHLKGQCRVLQHSRHLRALDGPCFGLGGRGHAAAPALGPRVVHRSGVCGAVIVGARGRR